MTVRATYRLQFHRGFDFAAAEAVLPYLARLGISHVYASPITMAQPGSTHGYDVVDPTRINPELGGEDGFARFSDALKAHDLGLILDIVPNHLGVAGHANGWWQDVLARGAASRFAPVFDIDWSDKLLLPFLGAPLDQALAEGALALRRDADGPAIWAYDTHRFPLRPEDRDVAADADLPALLARQHYRLAWWREANDRLNWRRFFTITELAGVRQEDPAVFELTHALILRLWAEGRIDGVRIDHVDGLTDPAAYLAQLRRRLDETGGGLEPWVVVEKILGPGETMPADWPVDGTSGYDFMEQVSALLHDPAGAAPLAALWAALSGRPADFQPEELAARRDMLAWEFEGQLAACARAFSALAATHASTRAYTPAMWRRAIAALLWVFPVYRTYGTGRSAPPSDAAIRAAARARVAAVAPPGELPVIDAVLAWLAGSGPGDKARAAEAVRRFQQLSAPIAAKAVEDTAFYRYGRLLSRNDVGFDPARFALAPADFHEAMAARALHAPRAMLATATHDHKRGEDVRARLAVLSEVPGEWAEAVARWRGLAAVEGLAPDDLYQLWQMLVGAWPDGLAPDDADGLRAFAARIGAWQQKALREAKLRSSWAAPDEAYEAAAQAALDRLIDPRHSADLLTDLAGFVARLRPAGEANGLVQTLLRNTVPGVPDLYQGCEFADLSLVDPDNRSPVDYATRAAMLARPGGRYDAAKQALIARLLAARRARPELWAEGNYAPLAATGARRGHVLAFVRRRGDAWFAAAAVLHAGPVLIAAGRRQPPADWWGDTALANPAGGAPIPAARLFAEAPVALLSDS